MVKSLNSIVMCIGASREFVTKYCRNVSFIDITNKEIYFANENDAIYAADYSIGQLLQTMFANNLKWIVRFWLMINTERILTADSIKIVNNFL